MMKEKYLNHRRKKRTGFGTTRRKRSFLTSSVNAWSPFLTMAWGGNHFFAHRLPVVDRSLIFLGLMLLLISLIVSRKALRIIYENEGALKGNPSFVRAMAKNEKVVAAVLFLLVLTGILITIRYKA